MQLTDTAVGIWSWGPSSRTYNCLTLGEPMDKPPQLGGNPHLNSRVSPHIGTYINIYLRLKASQVFPS